MEPEKQLPDDPTAVFQRLRPRLFGIAYRMLGIRADAEDIVQEAWLRWHGSGSVQARTPEAWLVTVVTRLSIDRLRAAIAEREHYVGPWLPEPLVEDTPENALEAAGDLSTAFLMMMERLAPEERAVFLLHQVFEFDHAEVAAMVDKRAREGVQAQRPRFAVKREAHLALLERFVDAARSNDPARVQALLAFDATYMGDGGGKAKTTVRTVFGAGRIARLVAGVERKWGQRVRYDLIQVNGEPGLLTWRDGVPDSITTLLVEDGLIAAIYVVRNPDKLHGLDGLRVPSG
jgi:RNA polymerase sigma-70 factor (ECF subfamily)